MAQPREQMISKPEELPEVVAHLAAARRFGLDTEFVGEETYRPRLCLVQVATPERLILIDPITVGALDDFWKLVVDPTIQVVVHAGREEARLCHQWTGRRPTNFFDLQIAAGLVGFSYPMGHGNLVSQLLGISLSKTETLTEWRDRPLTPHQIRYAYDDVRFLLPLAGELDSRLHRLDRTSWIQEESDRLCRLTTDEEPVLEKWRRLKGLGSLSRRQLAIARELYQWREDKALERNRPVRIICRDDLIVEIARRGPHRDRDLQVVRGLPKRDMPSILEAVERARALPADQCPPVIEREQDAPQVALLTSLLTAVLGQICAEAQLAAGLVSTVNDLRTLVRSHVERTAFEGPSLLNEGWRNVHIRPLLEAVLRGERGIRIARPQSATPLELPSIPPVI